MLICILLDKNRYQTCLVNNQFTFRDFYDYYIEVSPQDLHIPYSEFTKYFKAYVGVHGLERIKTTFMNFYDEKFSLDRFAFLPTLYTLSDAQGNIIKEWQEKQKVKE